MAACTVILAVIHVLLIKEGSNLDEPKVSLNKETLKKYFFFPTHDARDFYLALVGKFFYGGWVYNRDNIFVVPLYRLYRAVNW